MPHVEEELLTLPQHLSSPPVFSEVRVTRSLISVQCSIDRCLCFCHFPLFCLSFDLQVLITPLASSNFSWF